MSRMAESEQFNADQLVFWNGLGGRARDFFAARALLARRPRGGQGLLWSVWPKSLTGS
jgi:hypothetical protein